MTRINTLYLVLLMAVMTLSLSVLVSCNHKDDDDDVYTYSTSEQTTLITGFALQTNSEVLANLDSVHFTVDYDNGLIYNADSLPVGTDITELKVTVQFLNTVNSAVFTITGATEQADTTITYSSSMSKSLDFTGKTILTVTSADKSQVKDYEVKVLVHKVNPDSLAWPMAWKRDLPGYDGTATACKTVCQGSVYRMITSGGTPSCILLTASTPDQTVWDKQRIDLPFSPDIPTLVASDNVLYMLSTEGELYSSEDGLQWTSCGVKWHSILGAYEDRALGIIAGDDDFYHDEYPRSIGFVTTRVEDGFPVAHTSDMVVTENEWTVSQQAIIVGGLDSDGKALNTVWGYDGNNWGKINNSHSTSLPAITDATLFPYYTYRPQAGVRRYARQQSWYIMGGKLADGTLNSKIYLSSTQGVTWTVAGAALGQPTYMPAFYGAQAFVNHETMTAASTSNAPRHIKSFDGSWDCPFIYLYGGYNDRGALLPNVWRGVYIRMTNYPVY